MKIPRERIEEWLRGLRAAREAAEKLRRALGDATVILHGSYARGDFNRWSDIDLVVVSPRFRGIRVLDRYNLLPPLPPRLELVLLTPEEFGEALRKPVWRQALRRGAYIVVASREAEQLLREAGIELEGIETLEERVERLLARDRRLS